MVVTCRADAWQCGGHGPAYVCLPLNESCAPPVACAVMRGEGDPADAIREYAAICRRRAAELRELASSQLQRATRWGRRGFSAPLWLQSRVAVLLAVGVHPACSASQAAADITAKR
jgi:hypothetical protein